jgi:hypothetical protein
MFGAIIIAFILFIVAPLVVLALIAVHACETAPPDPEDERWSKQRLEFLKTRDGGGWHE